MRMFLYTKLYANLQIASFSSIVFLLWFAFNFLARLKHHRLAYFAKTSSFEKKKKRKKKKKKIGVILNSFHFFFFLQLFAKLYSLFEHCKTISQHISHLHMFPIYIPQFMSTHAPHWHLYNSLINTHKIYIHPLYTSIFLLFFSLSLSLSLSLSHERTLT